MDKPPDQEKVEQYRKQVEDRRKTEAETYDKGDPAAPEMSSPFIRDCLFANEMGDGAIFKLLQTGKYVFDKFVDRWLVWTGHHWDIDVMDSAAAVVEGVVEIYNQELDRVRAEIAKMDKEDPGLGYMKELRKSLSGRISALRTDARRRKCLTWAHTSHEPLAIRGHDIDCRPWLLACPNGVLDLKTGVFRPGAPEDYLLKACNVEWKGFDAARINWTKALSEIYSGNEDIVRFVQRLCGYALIGEVREHIIAVFSGRGRNGKGSIIVGMLSHILGSLAEPIPPEMLLNQGYKQTSASPTPDIMSLRGLRIAFASETDEHARFSPGRVKWLTGGDKLVGRNPHDKYPTTFNPTHTLFLLTNHEPHAPGDDYAFWRRVLVIPHEISFVDGEPHEDYERKADLDLPEKLRAEAAGILAWMVEGCLMYQKEGLNPPGIIKRAVAKYQRREDLLADFIEACCIKEKEATSGSSHLFTVFEVWWKINVSKWPLKQKAFGNLMGKKFEKEKVSGIYRYFGLRLADHLQKYIDENHKIDEKEIEDLIRFGTKQDDRDRLF